jgi:protein AbiQ
MRIVKLTDTFFQQNTHLCEILDRRNGSWDTNKTRGYGIAIVDVRDGLQFGIPLRSKLSGPSEGHYKISAPKGLDYSKAVLIISDTYIGPSFTIQREDFLKIQGNQHVITKKFGKYVGKYIQLAHKQDWRALEIISVLNPEKLSCRIRY